MKFTDFLRAMDDSDLDPYEMRYLIHIWRRGSCWEPVRKIGELCHMSKSQAHRVKQSLTAKGWIIEVVEAGRVVQKVAAGVPTGDIDTVVVVPTGDAVVPTGDAVVPVRHALPINRTKLNNKLNGDTPPAPADPELQAAKDATFALIEFWAELTKRQYPAPASVDFRDKWLKPFNAIWIMCGRDVEAAKVKVQTVRSDMANRGITIFDPAKLPAHVQVLVDAELRPMTERMNGSGAGDVTAERESLWQRAIREIGAGWVEDALLRQAIQAIGGSSSIKQANEFTTRQLKERLFHEYQRSATTA